MAPRKGGGGGGIISTGGNGGGDNYDPTLYFQLDERRAIAAQAICAALLVLTAVLALLMVMVKSWLRHDGRRNKSRLIIFLLCLCFIITGRAVSVANTVLLLQGPNNLVPNDLGQNEPVREYYLSKGFDKRDNLIDLFAWLSTSLFFVLVLFEVVRSGAQDVQRHTAFKNFNLLTIFVLSALAAANWIIDVLWIADVISGLEIADYTTIGLIMAYLGVSLFFATVMYLNRKITASRTDGLSKARGGVLTFVIATLWLNEVLYIAAYSVRYWGSELDATPAYALFATTDALWMVLVMGMVTLAWKSHRAYSAVPTQPGAVQYGDALTGPGMVHGGKPHSEHPLTYSTASF